MSIMLLFTNFVHLSGELGKPIHCDACAHVFEAHTQTYAALSYLWTEDSMHAYWQATAMLMIAAYKLMSKNEKYLFIKRRIKIYTSSFLQFLTIRISEDSKYMSTL